MRIQHNIPAMSAYRNYTNNTSSLSKNLEKLSSGYKINRAGDDAAGLAISEKMRAQITGLEVAQKNAKDGISLVQTAEGALTEVHSMLNRMYELAEQSANGTYDNDVDRLQLQKEVNQLRSEIDRISEASNFNGIKLLDGSMNSQDVTTTNLAVDTIDVPILQDVADDAFTEVGEKTVLKEAPTTVAQTKFDINLQTVKIDNAEAGKPITLTLGEGTSKFTLHLEVVDGTAGDNQISITDATDTAKLAEAFKDAFENQMGGKIAGQDFTATVDEGSNVIKFVQDNPPTKASEVVKAALPVKVEYAGAVTTYTATASTVTPSTEDEGDVKTIEDATVEFSNVQETIGEALATQQNITITLNYNAADDVKNYEPVVTIGGQTYNATLGTITQADANGTVPITLDDGTVITIKGNTGNDWDAVTNKFVFTASSTKTETPPAPGEGGGQNSWSVNTTNNVQGAIDSPGQLASTQITMKDSFATDGGTLTIGKQTYVFKVGNDSEVTAGAGQTLVTISDNEIAAAGGDIIDAIGMKLSQDAINGNSAFTLGYDQATNQLSIHEKDGQTDFDEQLQSLNSFQKLIHASRMETTKTTPGAGKSLTLQIGDTSDPFNKLVVDVKACNAASMGIGAIDISTQEGAAAAMTAIKSAINYVSDVRGDLGATQNRLDHTINNLSVMQENIQDAESTIRDVDVAKEMMDYTKNNILVQSAQAMLAQANQLPQGVLQLLQ